MKLGEQNWKDASEMTDKIVIIPTGAHEQHGHHLPLLTDAMIGEEIIKRAEAELQDSALILPMLWLGHSPHHLQFPGTVSVSSETYIRIIQDITESLIGGGFRRLIFFNSHAGNMTPTSVALGNLQIKYAQTHPDAWLVSTSWFALAAEAIRATGKLKQSKISHACEWETSQIMAAHPELVQEERPAVNTLMEVNGEPSQFFTADYSKSDGIGVARTIDQCSPTGAFGWPNEASVEKGNLIFDIAAKGLVSLVKEFAQWPEEFTPTVTP